MKKAAAILIAFALVGCGGSSDSGSSVSTPEPQQPTEPDSGSSGSTPEPQQTNEPVTRSAYIPRGDAVCRKANKDAKARNERVQRTVQGAADDADALKLIAPQLRNGYEAQRRYQDEFEAVPAPPTDRDIIDKLNQAHEEQTALVGRLADAAESGDASRFTSLTDELERARTRSQALAQGYGFKECGSGKNEAD